MRVRFLSSFILSTILPALACAQTQAVSPAELRQAVSAAVTTRQKNLDQSREFFASEPVRAALKSGKVDYQQVQKAVSALSADELANLSARTQQVQRDFAAGALSNQDLTYIVIALAAAVLVLVVVAA